MKAFIVNLNPGENVPDEFFDSDVLILNIPPSNTDELSYLAQLDRVIHVTTFKHCLFISSTGVYPSLNREVFEEDAVESAKSRSGISLLRAEKKFHSTLNTVVRFGGLVDERRHPGRWFAGRRGLPGGADPVNMIHLEDCIGAIKSIIDQEIWGELFSVCHPEHPSKADYYERMTKLFGLEPPEFLMEKSAAWKQVSPMHFQERSGYQFRRSIWEI